MKRLRWPLALLAFCLLTLAARCWNLGSIFVAGGIYFVDADCYSRMTRAALILEGHGPVVRHHDFENFPHGITPHTTAPLDWLIVAGKRLAQSVLTVIDPAGTSLLRTQALDVSGALISPLLGVVTCAWIAWWSRRLGGGVAAWTAPALFAVSPVLVHATALGRPDHQSLVLLLLAVALGAELRLAELLGTGGAGEKWALAAGAAWAGALWVSLYEPLVLLAVVLVLWGVGNRRRFTAPECRWGWGTFFVVLLMAVLIDGWRVVWPDAEARAAFAMWQTTVGELRHLPFFSDALPQWLGWWCVVTPVVLGIAASRSASPLRARAAVVLMVLLVLLGLTLWQLRWGYFLALAFAMSLPWQFAAAAEALALLPVEKWPAAITKRVVWIGPVLFTVGLWSLAAAWDAALFPDTLTENAREERAAEGVKLREVAARMRAHENEAFIAPWWLSPALAYWSRQPGVAGSSHQALPGTMETARFFLAASPEDAEAIARRLGVSWIVTDGADEDGVSRLVKAYAPLLGGNAPEHPWGVTMHERGRPRERVSEDDLKAATPELRARLLEVAERAEREELGSAAFTCVFQNDFFKLFRVKKAAP